MSNITIKNRQRFLTACHAEAVDRPPVWMMRQAGRALPEYRALKEKHSFLEMVRTPDLATEVTLQPIRRFGFDAAVLFSDILVVPEAMGQAYEFRDGGGIQMAFSVTSETELRRLNASDPCGRLEYVFAALRQLRGALGNETALLGFAGSPWTLANFMMEGGSTREFTRARQLFYSDRALFNQLMEKLTGVVSEFLARQIEAGADAVQIFDSLGGLLADNVYAEASGQWITRIIQELSGRAPVIVFSRGAVGHLEALIQTRANVLSFDWSVPLAATRRRLPPRMGVQGNLDPLILTLEPEVGAKEALRILEDMRTFNGFVFNLGHGVTPEARLETIERVVNVVQNFS